MNKVLIVGAGPIGLLLATSLKQFDIHVSIIDKIELRDEFSKALTVTSASLKVFHGLGLVESFLKHGKKVTKAEIFFNKKRITSVNKKYLDSLYNFYLSIPQSKTEYILEQALNGYSTYVEYQKELTDITQDKESVRVEIRDLKTERSEIQYFDFIVGCDGAHSRVRKLLTIPFIGDDYDIHFILGDAYFCEDASLKYATYYVEENGFIGLFPKEDGAVRIVAQKKGRLSDPITRPTKEELQSYLNDSLPNKLTINDLVWSSRARVINRIAQTYRVNRVFLAGDACHLFSSVGGQVMNTGIQDAFDLAWKLAHYLNGLAKPSLLDTYNHDRRLAADKVLAATDFYTKLIIKNIAADKQLNYFQPSFSNRKFYKEDLPEEFAGYNADYSRDKESIVGKHVPYVKFQKCYYGLLSTYDLLRLKKHILFRLNTLVQSTKELSLYAKFMIEIIVEPDEIELINKLKIDNQHICLISPAGYIAAHDQLSAAIKYLNKHYLI